MPFLRLTAARMPSDEQCERLLDRLTAVVREELGVPPEVINVVIEASGPRYWGVAGVGLHKKFEAAEKEAKGQ